MRYCLGVDIGNCAISAAVSDASGVRTVSLGRQMPSMPALAHATSDGTILTGDDAVRATDLEPMWTARLLVRRLDEPTPFQLGARTYEVSDLLGTVLRDALNRVTTQCGGPPEHVVLTRPAALGPRGRDLLAAAAARAGRPDATTTTAPLACGTWFARVGRPGGPFAVYDFGGGAFEAAVLRADPHRVELASPPNGVARLGGADLDELVRRHLDARLGGELSRWDPHTREGARTRNRVLAACAAAKETLSTQGVAEVTLPLPSGVQRCVLHREEIDALFRGPVADTVAALQRVLAAAGERTGVIVLTGGSARIPLVTALVREAIGPGVRIEHAPEGAVARGAALLASLRAGADAPGPPVPTSFRSPATAADPAQDPPPLGSATPRARPGLAPSQTPRPAPPAGGPSRAGTPQARPGTGAPAGPRPNLAAGRPAPAPEPMTEFLQPADAVTEFVQPAEAVTELVRTPVPQPPPAPPPSAPRPPAAPGAPATVPADADRAAAKSAAEPESADRGDRSWRNPSIGRPLAIALALLALVVAIGVIVFVVLHRLSGASAGLVAPQSLVEAWWTALGPRF